MIVPPMVLRSVEDSLEARDGQPVRVKAASPIRGGCINPSARIETEDGTDYFLKWNPSASSTMFAAEADGLRALGRPGSLRVPEVLGYGGSGTSADPGWLLLEFIPQGRAGSEYGVQLGEGLAALHSSVGTSPGYRPADGPEIDPEAGFGWHRANFIGSLPQENSPRGHWGLFWRDLRLEPQLRLARELGYFTGSRGRALDALMDRLEQILPDHSGRTPDLLHGDLWSGNFYPGPGGEPVLIDPAVYLGHGEVDLAMMELFGSFPRGFVEAFTNGRGLALEYESFRRDLYQLYYLLVHVNLFGGGYETSSLAAAERVLRNA